MSVNGPLFRERCIQVEELFAGNGADGIHGDVPVLPVGTFHGDRMQFFVLLRIADETGPGIPGIGEIDVILAVPKYTKNS